MSGTLVVLERDPEVGRRMLVSPAEGCNMAYYTGTVALLRRSISMRMPFRQENSGLPLEIDLFYMYAVEDDYELKNDK